MRCAVIAVVVLTLASLTVIQASASDVFRQYGWLHRGDPSEGPPIEESLLTLSPERRDELEKAGYGFVDLLWHVEMTIGARGELLQHAVTVRHFLNHTGIQEGGSLGDRVQIADTTLYLDRAYVQQPEGELVDIDLSTVQVVTAPSLSVFSDQYLVVVPFEGLVPGSTAVLRKRTIRQTQEWPLPWSHLFFTRWWVPVERMEVVVRWGIGVEEPSWVTNDENLQCERSSERELTCAVTGVGALPIDPDVRSLYDPAPLLVVSEPQTWSMMAQTEADLVAKSQDPAGEIQPLVDRLVEGVTSPTERLERIHRYVADEIRYVGLEHGTGAVVPANVAQTIDRRFADCKGKVALFLELAERAGLDAWAVLVGTEHFDLESLIAPSWHFFDHLIACVRLAPRPEPLCIDLTDPNAGTGDLPPPLYGAVALDLRSDTEGPRTLAAPEYIWDFHAVVENRMDCEGNLTEELSRRYSGPAAIPVRALLRGLPTRERLRWAEENYQQVTFAEAKPTIRFEGLDDPNADVVVHSRVEFPGIVPAESSDYVEPDIWLQHFASWFSTENRHHAYLLDGVRIRTTNKYQLCPDRKVQFTGATLRLESEFGALWRHYTDHGGSVEVETTLTMPRASIDVTELPRYRRFVDTSLNQSMIWFSFEP